MNFTTRLRDRLPSALIALALQGGLFALLTLSFEMVRQLPVENEAILVLPPLARPLPAPMTIDARGRNNPAPDNAAPPPRLEEAPVAAPVIGVPAAPGATTLAAPAQGQARPDCSPSLPVAARRGCPPPSPAEETQALLHPDHRVKDEDYYAAEKAQRDAPFTLPGAGGGPLGILLTALFNPGAFADKHNYNAGPPLPPRDGEAAADPRLAPPQHASDQAFKDALQAINDRKRAQSGRPPAAPAGAAQ